MEPAADLRRLAQDIVLVRYPGAEGHQANFPGFGMFVGKVGRAVHQAGRLDAVLVLKGQDNDPQDAVQPRVPPQDRLAKWIFARKCQRGVVGRSGTGLPRGERPPF